MKLSQLIEQIEKYAVTEGRDERKEKQLMQAVDAACVAVAEAADVVGHKLDDLYDYAEQNGYENLQAKCEKLMDRYGDIERCRKGDMDEDLNDTIQLDLRKKK